MPSAKPAPSAPVSPSPELLLAAIVESSDDAIVSKNLDGIITTWNRGAERLFGYRSDEAVGRSIKMVVPTNRLPEEDDILSRIRRGERVDHFETVRRRKDGTLIEVSVTISPILSAGGEVVGASKIARDITDLKQAAAEREHLLASEREARIIAEQANRAKDEFVSIVSHELRTPLNAILGWTDLLREAGTDPKIFREAVDTIQRNVHAQAKLVEDLLDLGRISSGKMKLDVEWISLPAVLREAVASVQHAADTKGISIKTVANEVRGGMMGDRQRLQQVLWNLLSNAIKFTPRNGKVVVTIARVNSHVEIAVADNGRGIDAAFLPHLFERFRQADSSTTRQSSGLGIGLALAKQLVELHGGEVRAESAGLEKGSTFTISLPISALLAPTQEDVKIGQDEAGARMELAGAKVLAVDDDKDSLRVVVRILESRGAEVRAVSSARDGLEALASFRPDVILSDIGMPGSDGYEFIQGVRKMPSVSSVPAAALTALARSEDRMRALQAGFQTHIAKPVAAAELIAVVRNLKALHEGSARGGASN